jgi:2-deoxy-D-gluconate 3-dehydrogenase
MMDSYFDLTGKSALVTGGASGLGAAIALGLAEAGADVTVVTSRNRTMDVQSKIEQLGRKAHTITADLSQDSILPQVIDEAVSQLGKLDILVNNSGIIRRGQAADFKAEDWHDVIGLNLNTTFFLSQLAGRQMMKQGGGKIINIASMLSFQGGINVASYVASKHGVAGITKALGNEWISKGINVNAIAPGYFATDITSDLRSDDKRSREILERIPAARWGSADDLKGPTIFLASKASNYLSGEVICVDGGWMTR